MNKIKHLCLALSIIGTACQSSPDKQISEAASSITEEGFDHYMAVIANDSLLGRKPFTEGEVRTINYLERTFKELGLAPGNGDSYRQEVPMVEITSYPQQEITFNGKNGKLASHLLDDIVLGSRRVQEKVDVTNTDLVFAGFGIVAPEYNWNDYDGLDVKGKTVVVMINDPGFYDPTLFKGKNMTYYGRWTYKFEEAARQGATGALIIHQEDAASYGWHVVRNGWSGPQLNLQTENNGADRAAFEGWISGETAAKLLQVAGQSIDLLEQAKKPGFKAVDLQTSTSVHIQQELKKSTSNNVLGLLKGSERPEEVIVYSAHWDHFGVGEPVEGDSIYNGAVDNGTGIAGLLELANAFKKAPTSPKRSILFIALTGEEEGLLGSAYYAAHPIFPLEKTVANINMDAMQPIGKTNDIVIVGLGQSEMDEYAERAAKKQGRHIVPQADASNGWFYRSDHFNFAKVGIPALYPATGDQVIGQESVYGIQLKKEYNKQRYHQPQDEYVASKWNIDGIVEDLKLLFDVGYTLSMEKDYPKWKKGSEFKSIGEQLRK
ncbi:M28 family metallopeptidase [Olivibacter sitiensis]|uniref:M28 family metallopeptidase n=1 Tax=Olivibacter sitiensis TaxID=376470 RepID=UPI001FDF3511|nr:M28 family metallopeptidase [Olivibacter sitiensis]